MDLYVIQDIIENFSIDNFNILIKQQNIKKIFEKMIRRKIFN